MDLNIPNKSLFKLGEVCSLTEVKPYVLRFWEKEFEDIDPILSSSGQKLYEHKDIEAIVLVKKLLFESKMSIEEAKKEIKVLATSLTPKEHPAPLLGRPQAEREEVAVEIEAESGPEVEDNPLAAAKVNLRQLLSKADTLRQRHNWD